MMAMVMQLSNYVIPCKVLLNGSTRINQISAKPVLQGMLAMVSLKHFVAQVSSLGDQDLSVQYVNLVTIVLLSLLLHQHLGIVEVAGTVKQKQVILLLALKVPLATPMEYVYPVKQVTIAQIQLNPRSK
jgi:hypothetical protein